MIAPEAMATIVAMNLDLQEVRDGLAGTSHAAECRQATGAAGAAAVLEGLGGGVPDLVVLGGDAAAAADAAEVLIDEPRLGGTPLVAWRTRGSLADTSRLLALGVQVVEGDATAFRRVCEEALDARQGRTIRVDAPTAVQVTANAALDLHGRRVLVADDDPAIAWYFADLLRARGCDVEEAPDGEAALDRARRMVPDLVISDIRMPRLDGLRLCRALRKDPVLADVPVVLLSWKEDWLHRAEENGVGATAYLGKRSAPEEVLACVADVLATHERLERRLREPGAVRGRLDGTAPYRLLRLACATRPDARLTVQCHPHGYEVRIRDGAPRSAVRVGRGEDDLRGATALSALLDERAGRFTLDVEHAPIEGNMSGSLHQQLAACVARSRRGSAVAVTAQVAPAAPPVEAAPPSMPAPAPPPSAPSLPRTPLALCPAPSLRPMVEASVRTLPMSPRPFVARAVVVARPATPERTLPLPPGKPNTRRPAPAPARTAIAIRRSWKSSLKRLAGVVAVAALGLVVGAGVRALRQPAEPPPAPASHR